MKYVVQQQSKARGADLRLQRFKVWQPSANAASQTNGQKCVRVSSRSLSPKGLDHDSSTPCYFYTCILPCMDVDSDSHNTGVFHNGGRLPFKAFNCCITGITASSLT